MIIAISGKMQSGKNTVGAIIQYLYDKNRLGYKTMNTEDDFNSYLKNNHHLKCDYQQKAFASKLKQIVSILTGIPIEDLEKQEVKNIVLGKEWWFYGYGEKEKFGSSIKFPYLETFDISSEYRLNKLTIRDLLQGIGTEAMRDVIHPNVWVNALFADYKPNGAPYDTLGDLYDDLKYIPSETKLPNWVITDLRFPNELEAIKQRGGISIRVNRFLSEGDGTYTELHPSETALDNAEFDYVIDNNAGIPELMEKVKEILVKEKII
jgi:hypothetical protein